MAKMGTVTIVFGIVPILPFLISGLASLLWKLDLVREKFHIVPILCGVFGHWLVSEIQMWESRCKKCVCGNVGESNKSRSRKKRV